MKSFLQRWGKNILGVVHGFDRLRFRGTKRFVANVQGMIAYLWKVRVLLKDFGAYAQDITAQVRQAIETQAQEQGRPLEYLVSSHLSKEDRARAIAERDGLEQGLIAVFKAVEPCWSYEVHRNRQTKHIELRGGRRKCLHYYHYFLDQDWGFGHVRLQSWFPFTAHVCLNGREALARQLRKAGIGYVRRDNCFTALDDLAQAQRLCDAQLRTDWPQWLNTWLRAHGLIRKVPKTHRYLLTDKGRTTITTLLAARYADTNKLIDAA
jgi:hypothetical protein